MTITVKGHWMLERRFAEPYTKICKEAAVNEETFSSFKRLREYIQIVGCDSHGIERGKQFLTYIEKEYPYLINHFDEFRKNDIHGSPPIYEYEKFGKFSPNTTRYIKVVGDLGKHFGDLNNKDITEIGSAYGGQCLITSCVYKFNSYRLVDMPEAIELSKKYLSKFNLNNVIFNSSDSVEKKESYLTISDYCLSEMNVSATKFFFDSILSYSNNVYLTMNIFENRSKDDCDRKYYLLDLLKTKFEVSEHKTLKFKGNTYIWVGKQK